MPDGTTPPTWTWLDTDFADGAHFFEAASAWLHSRPPSHRLHYVGLTLVTRLPPRVQTLLGTGSGIFEPGFHRFHLRDGRISLTLCVGDAHASLKELRMQADAIIGPRTPQDWSRWTWKLLAKQCRRDTTLHLRGTSVKSVPALLREAGFIAPSNDSLTWVFNPHWKLTRSKRPGPEASPPTQPHCAIIGAGLAGASVAYALALRGWQVTVLDRHAQAACGASGLPAGLAVPHVSKDDSPRSRLTRAGIHLLHQHARHLLIEGEEWSPTGVLELSPGTGIWHPQACWVRPATLVAAWLRHPAIRVLYGHEVHSAAFDDAQWNLRDAQGSLLVAAPQVVLANAAAVRHLQLSPAVDSNHFSRLKAIRGVMSMGAWPRMTASDPQPPLFPVNGDGSFLPRIPGPNGFQWHCGATFEQEGDMTGEMARGHAANQARLQKALPEVAKLLASQWDSPHLQAWSGERCTTHDRLPLVGALHAPNSASSGGLWCSIGMGSRGLSLAALCAEMLVAEMLDEPLPMEARLQASLRPDRFLRLTPS